LVGKHNKVSGESGGGESVKESRVELLENLVYFLSGGEISKAKHVYETVTIREAMIWFEIVERNKPKDGEV
jgi:hypothetical protein